MLTLGVAGVALAIWWLPALAGALVYDRAAILDGEVWRLLTCHLVHATPRHLIFDLAGFLLAGTWLESRDRIGFGWLLAGSALAVGVALLLVEPQLAVYCGLSGVVNALVAGLAVELLARGGRARLVGGGVLALVLAKIAWEFSAPRALLVKDVTVVPLSHAAGFVAGLVLAAACCLSFTRSGKHRTPNIEHRTPKS